MYTITKGPSKLVAQRRTGAQRRAGGGQGWVGVRAPGPPQVLAQRRLTRPPCTRRAHTAASGEQARRAPEMPAARAAHSAAPAGAATRTLAPAEVRRARPRLEPGPPIPRRPSRGPGE